MQSLNRTAVEIIDEAIDFADEVGIAVRHLDNDAVVLDFGIDQPGGIEAGLLLADLQTGGLASVDAYIDTVNGVPLLQVSCSTDHPALGLLATQRPDWTFEEFEGVGSGPAQLFENGGDSPAPVDYEEDFDFAVLAVESETHPTAPVAAEVATRTGVPTSGVYLPAFSPTSLAGRVATAAHAARLAVAFLSRIGYETEKVDSATAVAPVTPEGGADPAARGHTAIEVGGRAYLTVDSAVDRFDGSKGSSLADEDPDPSAVTPGVATIDLTDGPTVILGEVNEALLVERLVE